MQPFLADGASALVLVLVLLLLYFLCLFSCFKVLQMLLQAVWWIFLIGFSSVTIWSIMHHTGESLPPLQSIPWFASVRDEMYALLSPVPFSWCMSRDWCKENVAKMWPRLLPPDEPESESEPEPSWWMKIARESLRAGFR